MPWPVLALAIAAITFFALPLIGLLWRAPWGDVWQILSDKTTRTALRLSIVCSLWATGFSILFGVPLAWLLARVEFPGRAAVRALCTLSMVLPPVVGGVALFFALGRRGIVGQYLDRWFDIRLPFTTAGVVVAQTFVSMPFLVITVEAALRQLDARFEDAVPDARRVELVHVSPCDAARDPARTRGRCRAVLGARARRVRGDNHLRGQLPRSHADDAACRLPRARDQPAGGDRAGARDDRDLVRGARRAARALARGGATTQRPAPVAA